MRIETKIFLFGLALLVTSLPEPALAQSGDPGLQPGDLVEITVWQRDELTGQFTVAQDGTLVHPLYRQVRVTGLSAPQVEERLRTFLSEYEANPQVVVRPLYQVTISGQVMRPDIYDVPAGTTVSQAVIQAGGVTEAGKWDDVEIVRQGRTMEVDLREASTIQMPVQSGDMILVKAKGSVSVFRETILPIIQVGITIANIVTIATR